MKRRFWEKDRKERTREKGMREERNRDHEKERLGMREEREYIRGKRERDER